MHMRVLMIGAIGILLSACAAPKLPLNAVEDVTYIPTKAAPTSDVRGSQILEIRTYTPKEDNGDYSTGDPELPGARCLIKSDHYTATLVTPSGLRLPLYGHVTPHLSVECTKDGYLKAVDAIGTFNKTMRDRETMAQSGAGLLGVLVMAAYNAASDETNDDYLYAAPKITMPTATEKPTDQQAVAASEQ